MRGHGGLLLRNLYTCRHGHFTSSQGWGLTEAACQGGFLFAHCHSHIAERAAKPFELITDAVEFACAAWWERRPCTRCEIKLLGRVSELGCHFPDVGLLAAGEDFPDGGVHHAALPWLSLTSSSRHRSHAFLVA